MAVSAFIIAVVLPRNDIAGSVQSWQVGGIGGGDVDEGALLEAVCKCTDVAAYVWSGGG